MAKITTQPMTFKDVAKEITDTYGMSSAFAMNMQVMFERCFESEIKARGYKAPSKKTNVKTKKDIKHIISNKEYCPLPIEVIPNNMGINLNSVESIEWEKQIDGQLVNLTINFIPDNHKG